MFPICNWNASPAEWRLYREPLHRRGRLGRRLQCLLIRDIMFATYANEYLGCFDKMVESFRLVLDIFKRYHSRIIQASIIKPDVRHQTGQFMPARVHPPRSTPSPMRGAITSSMSMACSCTKWAT